MASKIKILLFIIFALAVFCHCGHSSKRNISDTQKLSHISQKENSIYYYLVSQLETLRGKENSAELFLDKSLEKDPNSSYLLTEKAYRLARDNKLNKAYSLAKKIYDKNPNDISTLLLLGKIHTAKNEPEKAIPYFQKVIGLKPEHEEANTLLAKEYLNSNDPKKAISTLKELIQLNPETINAYFFLASIYATVEKNYPLALATYQNLLEFMPDNSQILGLINEIYLAQKNYRKALETLLKIKELDPLDLSVQVRIGLIYYELKDSDNAIATFKEILQIRPGADKILYYLGLLYQEKNNLSEAYNMYSQVPYDSEFYSDAIARYVFLLKENNQIDSALDIAKQALAKKPLIPDFYDLVASLYVIKKDYTKALSIIQKGLTALPQNENLLFSLGVVYEKMGQWEMSVDTIKKVIDMNSENVQALNFVGYTYAEHGVHLEEALDLVEKALRLSPNDGFIIDSLGWIYYQMGSVNQALPFIEKANRLSPKEPTILEHLGDISLHNKNKRKARKCYEDALFELQNKKDKSTSDEEQILRIQGKIGGL